jgi:quercetin 2,3-dioxygenase
MPIEVRAPGDRFLTRAEGRTTWHSFSFGAHYDPHNTGFGALVAHNDELLPRGTGYDDHPHRDTEIVTWVMSGALRHRDSSGHEHVLVAGDVQRLSAGSGVVHAEVSASDEPTRFVQAWVRPDEPGLEPSYVCSRIGPRPGDGLVALASGDGEAGLPLNTRAASLSVASLEPGDRVVLPDAPRLHVFVASGGLLLDGHSLESGAVARLVDQGAETVAATTAGTQLLVWALP